MAARSEGELAVFDRSAGHARVEAQLDALLRVVLLRVQVHLRQLDLAAQKLLRQVGTVVRTVVVGAEDGHLAVEALLAQHERGRVAPAAAADDHHPLLSHSSTSWDRYPARFAAARSLSLAGRCG